MKMVSWIFVTICRFLCFLFIKFLYAMNWLVVKWGQTFNQTSTAKQTSAYTDKEIRQMRQSIDKMEENFNEILYCRIQSLKLDMKEVEIVLHKLHVDILQYTTAHPSFGTSNVEHQTSTIEATTIPSFQAFTPVSPDARSSSCLLSTGASKTDVTSHATPPSAAPIRERSSGTLSSASLPLKGIRAPAKLISAGSNTPATYSSVFTKNADVSQLSNPDILAAPSFAQHSPPVSKCEENYEGSKQPAVTGATTVPTAPAAARSVGADQTPVAVTIKEPAPAEPPSAVTSATQPIKFTIMPAIFIYTSAKSSALTPSNQDAGQAFKACAPAASSHHVNCPLALTVGGDNDEYYKETPITAVTTAPTAPATSHSAWGYKTPDSRTKTEPAPAEPLSATTSATQPIITSPAESSFTLDTLAKSSTVTPRNQDVRQAFKPCTPAASTHDGKWPSIWKMRGQNDEYCKETPMTGVTTGPTAPAASRSAWADQTPRAVTNKEPAPAGPLSDVDSATRPIKVITSPAEFSFTSDTLAKSSAVTPCNQDVRQSFKPCTPAASTHDGKLPSIWKISGQNDEYCKETPMTWETTPPTAPAVSSSAWADQTSRAVTKNEPASAEPLSDVTSATQPIKVITSPAEFSFTLDTLAKSSTVTLRNQGIRQTFNPCTPAASTHDGKWPSIWKIRGQNDEYCKETPVTGVTTPPTAPAAFCSAWADQTPRAVTKKEPAPAEPVSATTSGTRPIKVITSPAEFSFTSDTLSKSSTVTPRNQDARQAFKPCTPAAYFHHGKLTSIWKIRGQNDEYCKETPMTWETTPPTSPAVSSSAWGYQTPRAVTKKEPAPVELLSAATSATRPIKVITSPAEFSFTLDTLAKSSTVTPHNQDVRQAFKPCTSAAYSNHGKLTSIWKSRGQNDEYCKETPMTWETTPPTAAATFCSAWGYQTPRAVTKIEPAEPLSAGTSATRPIKVITSPAEFSFTLDTLSKSSTVTPRNQDVRQAFKPCTPAASSHHGKLPSIWKISGQNDEFYKETPMTWETTAPTATAVSSSSWVDQTPRAVTKEEPAPVEPLSDVTSATRPIKVITSPAEFRFTLDTLAKSSTVTPRNQDVRQAFKPCTPAASSHHGKLPSIWEISGQNDEFCKETPMTCETTAPTAPAVSSSAWTDQTPRAVTKEEPAPAELLSDVTSATRPINVTSPAEFSFTLDTLAKSSTVTPCNEDVRQAFKPCTPAASSHHGPWPSIWKSRGQNDEYCEETPVTGVTTTPTAPDTFCSAWADQAIRAVTKKEPAPAEPVSATTSATRPIKVITSPAEFSFTSDTLSKSSTVTPHNQDVIQAFKPCTPAASSHHEKWPSIWKISGQNYEFCKETPITGESTAPTAPDVSSSSWADQTPRAVTKEEPAPAEPLSDVTSATRPIKVITSPAEFSFTLDTLAKSSTVTPRNQDVRQAFKPCTPAASSHHGKWPSVWKSRGQNDEFCKEIPMTEETTAPTAPAVSSSAWADQTPRAVTKKETAPAEPLSATTSATQPIKVIKSPAEFSFTLDTLAKSSTVTPRNQDVRQAFKPCTPAASSHHGKWPSIWKSRRQNDEFCKEIPMTEETTAPAVSSSAWADQTPRAVTKKKPAPAEPLSATTSATQPIKVITSPAEFSFTLDTLAKSSTVTPRNQDVKQAFKPCTPAASSHHWTWPSIWKSRGQNDEFCKEIPMTEVTTAPTAPAVSSSAWADQTPRAVTKKEPAPAEPLSATTSATQPIKVITSPAEFSFTLDTLAKSSAVTPRIKDVRQALKPCTPAASTHDGKWPSICKIRGRKDEYCKGTPMTGVTTVPTAPDAFCSAWTDQTPRAVTRKEPAPAEPLSASTSATRPIKVITSPAEFSFTLDTLAKSSAVTPRNQDVRQAFHHCTPVASCHYG